MEQNVGANQKGEQCCSVVAFFWESSGFGWFLRSDLISNLMKTLVVVLLFCCFVVLLLLLTAVCTLAGRNGSLVWSTTGVIISIVFGSKFQGEATLSFLTG